MNAAPSQDLTARQALERMLELIRGIHGITDVTPELLQRTMGRDVRRIEEGHFGFGQRLPGNWAFSVERYLLQPHDAPQLELGFDPIPNTEAAAVTACEPDYAAFTSSLEGMGFARHSAYGEHGRWLYDAFDKPGIHVEVHPMLARAKDDADAQGTRCVQRVLLR